MGAEIDRLEVVVEAEASKANKQLDALIAKLEKISSSLNGINTSKLDNLGKAFNTTSSGINAASKSVGTISSRLQNMNSLLNKSSASTRNLAASFGMFYATMFPVIRLFKKLGNSIGKSMDYMETYNYFNVAMSKIGKEFSNQFAEFGYDSADAYGKSFLSRLTNLSSKMTGFHMDDDGILGLTGKKSLGLDVEQLTAFQAKIAQLTNSVGLIGEVSTVASQAMSMLSADMSSLFNIDLKSVMTNLSSGLIGQSRALYKYGIDITNATLQTYAYANGIDKALSEMTQSEKMQLRLLAILDQSKVAWGDMANTLNAPANQLRVLKQNFANLARMIGNFFLPVVAKVLPFINALVISLQRLFGWIGGLIGLDGKLKEIGINSGVGFSDDIDGLSDALEDADNSSDSLGNNLSDAEKSAKKLRNTLLGFDQINALNDKGDISNSGSTGALGYSIDLSGAIGDAFAEYQKVWDEAFDRMQNKAQETSDKIVGVFKRMWAAIEPFRAALVRLWDEGLSKLGSFAGTALIDFYNEFLVPIGKWSFGTAGAGLTRLVDVVNNGLLAIDWDRLNKSLKEFWIAIEPYAEQFGEGLIDFFEDVVGLGTSMINKFPGLLDKITGALNRGDPKKARDWGYNLGILLTAILGFKAVTAVVSGIASLGNAFATLSTGLGAIFGSSGLFAKIGTKISGLFGAEGLFGSGGIIMKALGGIKAGFAALTGISAPIVAIVAAIVAVIAGIIDLWRTSETFRDNVKNMWNIIGGAFQNAKVMIWDNGIKPLWDSLAEFFDSLYQLYEESGLKDIFETVVTGIGYILSVAIAGLITGIGKFVQFLAGIVKGIIDILNGILGFMKNFMKEHSDIFDGLKRIFSGINEFLAGVFSGDWSRAWNGIKDIFGGVFQGIVGLAKTPINKVIRLMNKLLSGVEWVANKIADALSFNIDIPRSLQKRLGMSSFRIGIPSVSIGRIPELATGGLVPNTGQLFLAREKGPELVGNYGAKSAVMNNNQIVDSVSAGVKQAVIEAMVEVMMANGNSQGNVAPVIENIFKVDSETLFKIAKKGKEKYDRRYQVVTEF